MMQATSAMWSTWPKNQRGNANFTATADAAAVQFYATGDVEESDNAAAKGVGGDDGDDSADNDDVSTYAAGLGPLRGNNLPLQGKKAALPNGCLPC